MRTVLTVPNVVVDNLRSAIYACYEELAAQVQADAALDTKLFGLLSFLAAIGSLLATLPYGLRNGRMLLLVGVVFGALACLVGSIGGSSPNTGPRPEEFYAEYGARTEAEYLAQLLSDLASTAQLNHEGLELRRQALAVALGAPALFVVMFGLISVT
ncbi:MAG TPA: hypothetical protein VK790_12980 [Solirubrobacteraceae bacterium]|jgi:hypothetical protein|nr:hypothetical protein [Solirubrobacteraceae bacterium]